MGAWRRVRGWFAQGIDILRLIASSLSDKPDAWDWAIERFEAQDRVTPPPRDPIVFTGSSSITLWESLERDMSPLPALNRGFGGARIDQVTYYADRIVIPYHPRAVVLFAGTNDIAGPNPKTAEQVLQGYLAFVNKVQAACPQTPIYYVSITPTPSRWKYWPIVCEANRLIQAHTATDPRLRFIDLTDKILGPDGKPNRALFRFDRLHPNKKAYALWTAAIKPVLVAGVG